MSQTVALGGGGMFGVKPKAPLELGSIHRGRQGPSAGAPHARDGKGRGLAGKPFSEGIAHVQLKAVQENRPPFSFFSWVFFRLLKKKKKF